MAHDARIVLQQRLSQQLVMTPQLRQAIKILQVSRTELETLVDQELTENPLLEEQIDDRTEQPEVPTVDGQNGSSEEYQADAQGSDDVAQASSIGEIDWKEYAENYSNDFHGGLGHSGGGGDDDERRAALENVLVKRTSLPDHLTWQLRLSDLSEPEKEVGAMIIGSLDKDGYLPLQLEEIAFLADTWPDMDIVARVLARLQDFDPPGVAARSLAECLLIQLRQLGLDADTLPARIVRDYLPMLESRTLRPPVARARRLDRADRGGHEGHLRARAEARPRLHRPGHALRHARRLRAQGGRGVHRHAERGRAAAPARLLLLPAHARRQRRARGARLHPGEDAGCRLAHQVDPPAPADALHGHVEHREVPAGVPREGRIGPPSRSC
jgi:DNA-directed RNA polymerase specialized sigma54-like protein